MRATPKGDIRHLVPAADAIARMEEPARPALILFPRYGFAPAERPVAPSEVFVRLTQAWTNYTTLGEPGFAALTTLVETRQIGRAAERERGCRCVKTREVAGCLKKTKKTQ